MYVNTVHLMGNLVRDPDIKVINSGDKKVSVVRFTVAVNRSFKRKDGSWDEQTDWINCEAWDSGADKISKDFAKGDRILLDGSIRSESWEDKETGKTRSAMKVRVEKFEKIPRRAKSEGESSAEPNDAGESSEDLIPSGNPF